MDVPELRLVLVLITCINFIVGKEFTLEAENYAIHRQRVMSRSNALGGQSVWLHKKEKIRLDFCLEKQSMVQILNISYSNDGPGDTVMVALDDVPMGTFQSAQSSHQGLEWNKFQATEKIGTGKSFTAGRHVLTIHLSDSDQYGIEIDAVTVDINDSQLKAETFKCSFYCFDDIDYSDVARRDDVASATFVHRSYPTMCTEDSNVRLDIYHQEADKFRITAMPPKYKTFSNSREEDYSNCESGDIVWNFKDISLSRFRGELEIPGAVASVSGSPTSVHILVRFVSGTKLSKFKDGNILHLKVKNVNERSPINVSCAYIGTSRRWFIPKPKELTKYNTDIIWELHNNSWTSQDPNLLQITLYSSGFHKAIIESFSLKTKMDKKPPVVKEMSFSIFQNNDFIIKGENMDSWWLGGTSMTLRRADNGQSFKHVECLSVHMKEPWSDRFSKIFKLCQDGCLRILPVTPHGLDWIPFGSKIIIGQSNPDDKKPYAALSSIDIDPERLKFKLKYHDGTSMALELEPSRFDTSVKITNYKYAKDRKKFPALSFQSMWVANGRADVDHMTINGDKARPIMTTTGPLHGISAVFFRKCISSHNTLSPDIKIEVLGNGE